MTFTVNHATYGQIEYTENFWTGKKDIVINGVKLVHVKKNKFVYQNGETKIDVTVQGNFMSGAKLVIGAETVEVGPKPTWYETACSIAIFFVILVWGNSVYLCSIFPVIGGAIGGAVSGLMAILNLQAMKSAKSIVAKLCIWIGMMIATIVICFLLAVLYVLLLA